MPSNQLFINNKGRNNMKKIKKQTKDEIKSFRLNKDTARKIKVYAKNNKVSASEVIRLGIVALGIG